MRRILLALAFAVAMLAPHPAVAAIPEPPPYFWEYTAPGTVAFIPCVLHSGALIPPEQLAPGW
jgi:hypothetical protein